MSHYTRSLECPNSSQMSQVFSSFVVRRQRAVSRHPPSSRSFSPVRGRRCRRRMRGLLWPPRAIRRLAHSDALQSVEPRRGTVQEKCRLLPAATEFPLIRLRHLLPRARGRRISMGMRVHPAGGLETQDLLQMSWLVHLVGLRRTLTRSLRGRNCSSDDERRGGGATSAAGCAGP